MGRVLRPSDSSASPPILCKVQAIIASDDSTRQTAQVEWRFGEIRSSNPSFPANHACVGPLPCLFLQYVDRGCQPPRSIFQVRDQRCHLGGHRPQPMSQLGSDTYLWSLVLGQLAKTRTSHLAWMFSDPYRKSALGSLVAGRRKRPHTQPAAVNDAAMRSVPRMKTG